ncbi:Chaperone surA [Gossypium australe]|uniref:Chaperone surA n=1 Tax=Gossypium australe TaxID=47621 RepID=A0A5B6X3Y9_9ROSI|nr:Chaperone surA [Gossypium australe]
MDPGREVADDGESNAPAPIQGTTPFESRPVTISQGGEAREAFSQTLNELLGEANVDDDPERAEFWLENSILVFDELSCTLEECLKCATSLLRDSAYHLTFYYW